MAVFTSEDFLSAAAHGKDWREAVKALLDMVSDHRKKASQGSGKASGKDAGDKTGDLSADYNLGFLYLSDSLAEDAESILVLLKSVTGIENWTGCSGVALYAADAEYMKSPAISMMLMNVSKHDFRMIPSTSNIENTQPDIPMQQQKATYLSWQKALSPWISKRQPMLTLLHGIPDGATDYGAMLPELDQFIGGFTVGGLTSARMRKAKKGEEPQDPSCHIQNDIHRGGFSGVVFSQGVGVATAVAQGCTPIGPYRTITKADKHVIQEIDGKPAYEALKEDITTLASVKTGTDTKDLKLKENKMDRIKSLLKGSPPKQEAKEESKKEDIHKQDQAQDQTQDQAQNQGKLRRVSRSEFPGLNVKMDLGEGKMFKGDIHVAFSVPGSDKDDDYLVRHALAVDQSNGWIAVAEKPVIGDRVMFVNRDQDSVKKDLTKTLLSLRARLGTQSASTTTTGNQRINAKAALYISCAQRKMSAYEKDQMPEIKLIREILGDIPLAGFAASGEVSNARIYGYSGLIILFL